MTPTEAAIERIELLVNKLLSDFNVMLNMQSDLLASLKERSKREEPPSEQAPKILAWQCGWIDLKPSARHSISRAMQPPWLGYICVECARSEATRNQSQNFFKLVGQDLAAGE